MSSSSTTSADDQREALLETLRGYKVRTAPSQLFPGQCGVVALAPIAKGESVFPCNGELSNDVINLTFEEVASLPSHSRKLVWAFFQPNHQDPRSAPREKLTFPVPVNGLVHVGNSFFCNSADGTGQDANVEAGERIDGSGYAELVAMRDIQVGEELLDSYPIWDYDGSGEFFTTIDDGADAVEFLGFCSSSDEAQEILDFRHHMANLKAKVTKLEQLKIDNEGQITGLKRQVHSTSSDNRQLKTKMARLTEERQEHLKEIDHLKLAYERAMVNLKSAHERIAGLERKAADTSNSRLWWGCVNRFNTSSAVGYRDTSTTDLESEDDNDVAAGIANDASDYQVHDDDDVDVHFGTLCLDQGASETATSDESHEDDSRPIADDWLLKLREMKDNDDIGGIDTVEDSTATVNRDDGDDSDFPPPPPLPGQVVQVRKAQSANDTYQSNIGFRWDAEHLKGQKIEEGGTWKERYEELVEYKNKFGDCLVPKKYGCNRPLGTWVAGQRQMYRLYQEGKKKSELTRKRIAMLKKIGFIWDASSSSAAHVNDEMWDQRRNELIEYKSKHGDYNVPRNEEHRQLSRWVDKQRSEYRLWKNGEKKSQMTEERITKLEEIDFAWNAPPRRGRTDEEIWNQRLIELIEYKNQNGDCLVPQKYEANKKLGFWVGRQRREYSLLKKGKKSQITEERISKLNAIGFVWSVFTRKT